MNDAKFMDVLNSRYYLLEKSAGFLIVNSRAFHDVIKELAAVRVLHDEEQLLRRLDNFVKLDDMRVPQLFEDLNFLGDPLDVSLLVNLLLFEDFDGDLLYRRKLATFS